ncbi:MAG: DUF6502 family protein, partial [Gammaproteobacteria bacterium]|nr:DUF6502 family protein [Gammaproteobacteria bacterium]
MTHQAILDPRQAGTDDQRSATLCFASKVLKWLVKLLIKAGVSCDEFNQLARWHYVNEFYSDPELWQPRRKPFKSKAAVLCGLPRKEVMRLRGMSAPGVITEKINRVWRVLGGWTTDSRYLDKSGQPKSLPFASNRGADVRQLAKECNTDVPARTLLDELMRTGCVEEMDNGNYIVKNKGYIPFELPTEMIEFGANSVEFLLSTIVHNINHPSS